MNSSLSQDLVQRLFHVRVLVPPYTNLQDSVELFPCPFISKNPETCPHDRELDGDTETEARALMHDWGLSYNSEKINSQDPDTGPHR